MGLVDLPGQEEPDDGRAVQDDRANLDAEVFEHRLPPPVPAEPERVPLVHLPSISDDHGLGLGLALSQAFVHAGLVDDAVLDLLCGVA